MDTWIPPLLAALALPKFGLTSVFVIALLSATLLPMGSEPASRTGRFACCAGALVRAMPSARW